MAEQPNSINDSETLKARLSEILATWPLYRTFIYQGKECHLDYLIAQSSGRFGVLPSTLKLFCDHDDCKGEMSWELTGLLGADERVVFKHCHITHRTYRCRNCQTAVVHYLFRWEERDKDSLFVKVGQYPELTEKVSEDLRKALDSEDLKMYKQALRMRNFNFGIAAVAYLRRVVENHMQDMLDILYDAAVRHNEPSAVLDRLGELKREKRFSVKNDCVGDLLPMYLRPPGKPNPMALLHDLTSDGLHAKSEAECVDIFDKCRTIFEYVFGKMRIEADDAKNYLKEMASLAENTVKGKDHKSK